MNRHRLVIDTSSGTSVAVFAAGELVSAVDIEGTMTHAESVGVAIQQALAEAKITPKDIGSVLVGRGPAPFTGLRIGIAAATAFALGRSVPLFGVVSLDAIALADAEPSSTETLLVTADARRGEVYWALYAAAAGVPKAIRGPSVGKLTDVLAELDDSGIGYRQSSATVSSSWLGRLFELQLAAGLESRDSTPLYLREADAVAPAAGKNFGKPVN